MVLVDTSIWIDHLHQSEPALVDLLEQSRVCVHPMILRELALGSIKDRRSVMDLLADMPAVVEATHTDVLRLVESRRLYGKGLSLVDAHLLASARITPGTSLWTRDKRLATAASEHGVGWLPEAD